MPTVYKIHRRVNAPIEFNGLKAQYILYAGGVIVGDLFLFAILYIAGISSWICLVVCCGLGSAGVGGAYHLSHRYGEYGWRKRRARRGVPKVLCATSRQVYLRLKK